MIAYLLLGSNEGDRQQWLKLALGQIGEYCGKIEQNSSIYSTAAWGLEEQPDFLNMAVEIETDLAAKELLKAINAIEQRLGRQRKVKWGQRTLDIDILYYGSEIIDEADLKIPHPGIPQRRFALVPLNEIAGEFVHPALGRTNKQLLEACQDQLDVHLGS